MGIALVLGVALAAGHAAETVRESISINRTWEELPDPNEVGFTEALEVAGEKLGKWRLSVGGVRFDGASLGRIVRRARKEPFLRVLREGLRMPIDGEDFLFFLDDVLVAGKEGRRGGRIWVPSGRSRKAGILLHTDDVFFDKPRLYAADVDTLNVDRPTRPSVSHKAKDGDLLGPGWIRRFRNRGGLSSLAEARPGSDLHKRMRSLTRQMDESGASVFLMSTVRDPRRGYLMWGAFTLSRAEDEATIDDRLALLEKCNADWGLNIQIKWRHPRGWQATREAAREMAAAYDVVFATETGARESKHYKGVAVDLVVRALPRELTLSAPDGERRTFDLSDAEQSRDLSLSPELIDWIEEHFQLKKLRADYPHWDDAVVLEGEGEAAPHVVPETTAPDKSPQKPAP